MYELDDENMTRGWKAPSHTLHFPGNNGQWSVFAADSGSGPLTEHNFVPPYPVKVYINNTSYINNINNTNLLPWVKTLTQGGMKLSSKELRLNYLELSLSPS